MSQKLDWEKMSPHPSTTLIVGPPRTGKTALMMTGLEHFYREGTDVGILLDKQYYSGFPKWIVRIDPDGKVPKKMVIGISDAHILFHSRDANTRNQVTRKWDIIQRERGHGENSLIWDSQEARVIDVNLISQLDTIIIKKYNPLQLRFERSELTDFVTEGSEKLQAYETKKYAYCYALKEGWEGVIGPYDPPSWFTDEISKMYGNVQPGEPVSSGTGKPIGDAITTMYHFAKAIGKSMKHEY